MEGGCPATYEIFCSKWKLQVFSFNLYLLYSKHLFINQIAVKVIYCFLLYIMTSTTVTTPEYTSVKIQFTKPQNTFYQLPLRDSGRAVLMFSFHQFSSSFYNLKKAALSGLYQHRCNIFTSFSIQKSCQSKISKWIKIQIAQCY